MVKVSVVMITYNHELHIKEAILGVLEQITNFDIELIIADDCSTDKTEAVVKEIVNTHPKSIIIGYTRHTANKGMMPNFIWSLNQRKGKYIALCEGDDYWTDPNKLQKQVDFLEANPDYSFCAHNVMICYENENYVDPNLESCTLNTQDLLTKYLHNFIPTCSILLNFEKINYAIPSWLSEMPFGDWPLLIHLSKSGDGYFMSEIMGVYRKHNSGFTSINSHLMNLKIRDFYILIGQIYPELKKMTLEPIEKLTNSIILENKENESMISLANRIKFVDLIRMIFIKVKLKLRRFNPKAI